MPRRLYSLLLLALSLGQTSSDRTEPDLELLVSTDLSIGSGGKSTRAGLSSNGERHRDTGIEPAFDDISYSGSATPAAAAAPQLIDDPVDSPPPSPAAASPSSAPISAGRRAYARFGILPDAEGFDQADFWQRLADHLGVDARSIELTVSPAVDASRIIGVAARIALPADRAVAGAIIRLLSRPTPELSRALAVTLVHPPKLSPPPPPSPPPAVSVELEGTTADVDDPLATAPPTPPSPTPLAEASPPPAQTRLAAATEAAVPPSPFARSVSMRLITTGAAATFPADALRAVLASSVGVPSADIAITTSEATLASGAVGTFATATIRTRGASEAGAIATQLRRLTPTAISSALGIGAVKLTPPLVHTGTALSAALGGEADAEAPAETSTSSADDEDEAVAAKKAVPPATTRPRAATMLAAAAPAAELPQEREARAFGAHTISYGGKRTVPEAPSETERQTSGRTRPAAASSTPLLDLAASAHRSGVGMAALTSLSALGSAPSVAPDELIEQRLAAAPRASTQQQQHLGVLLSANFTILPPDSDATFDADGFAGRLARILRVNASDVEVETGSGPSPYAGSAVVTAAVVLPHELDAATGVDHAIRALRGGQREELSSLLAVSLLRDPELASAWVVIDPAATKHASRLHLPPPRVVQSSGTIAMPEPIQVAAARQPPHLAPAARASTVLQVQEEALPADLLHQQQPRKPSDDSLPTSLMFTSPKPVEAATEAATAAAPAPAATTAPAAEVNTSALMEATARRAVEQAFAAEQEAEDWRARAEAAERAKRDADSRAARALERERAAEARARNEASERRAVEEQARAAATSVVPATAAQAAPLPAIQPAATVDAAREIILANLTLRADLATFNTAAFLPRLAALLGVQPSDVEVLAMVPQHASRHAQRAALAASRAAAQALALVPEGLPSELTTKLHRIEEEATDAAAIAQQQSTGSLVLRISAVVSRGAGNALRADAQATSTALGVELLGPVAFETAAAMAG